MGNEVEVVRFRRFSNLRVSFVLVVLFIVNANESGTPAPLPSLRRTSSLATSRTLIGGVDIFCAPRTIESCHEIAAKIDVGGSRAPRPFYHRYEWAIFFYMGNVGL